MARRKVKPEDLLSFVFVSDPQFSPKEGSVLFCRKHINDKNKYVTQLWLATGPGDAHQMTTAEGGAGNGRWSPCGEKIAFIAGRDKPASQIYILPTHGGEAKKLTSFPEGSLSDIQWSPDGKHIACTFREAHPNWTEKATKEREEKGGSTPPWEIDDVWYRMDGDGYFGSQRHAIYLVDTTTGEHKQLYKGGYYCYYSLDWLPDSTGLIVSHDTALKPWSEPSTSGIFKVALDGSATEFSQLPRGDKGSVSVSPDGKHVAYLGSVNLDDPWGVHNMRLWVVPTAGGEGRCLTQNDDYCLGAMSLTDAKDASGDGLLIWSPDSKAIYTNVAFHGTQQLGFVPLDEGGLHLLTEGQHLIAMSSLSPEGDKIACVCGDPSALGEIAVYDISTHGAKPEVWTSFNKAFHDEVELSLPEEQWITSPDGTKVQAWLMRPVGVTGKAPALLEIHGGPHTQYGLGYFHEFQVLAAAGYAVVFSNPRGSKGYGEAFCTAIKGDWGNKDWIDVRAVADWMIAHPDLDSTNLGVLGGSYGGYMTNWVIGHTHDFKAAITDRCVSNMISMSGNSDFPHNKDGYFGGTFYGGVDQIAELWRQSPMAYFDTVVTPTLVIHSEGDLRCNVEQGEQVFAALQIQGVESRFVRYPRETSHGMSRGGPPDLRLHRLGEIVGWFDRFLR